MIKIIIIKFLIIIYYIKYNKSNNNYNKINTTNNYIIKIIEKNIRK